MDYKTHVCIITGMSFYIVTRTNGGGVLRGYVLFDIENLPFLKESTVVRDLLRKRWSLMGVATSKILLDKFRKRYELGSMSCTLGVPGKNSSDLLITALVGGLCFNNTRVVVVVLSRDGFAQTLSKNMLSLGYYCFAPLSTSNTMDVEQELYGVVKRMPVLPKRFGGNFSFVLQDDIESVNASYVH